VSIGHFRRTRGRAARPDGRRRKRRLRAAGDRRNDADGLVAERCREAVAIAHVHAVDEHVDERAQPALLVEQQVGDRELAQRHLHVIGPRFELVAAVRLRRQQRRQEHDGHQATSTESTGGS
jgi:hypothetical protein